MKHCLFCGPEEDVALLYPQTFEEEQLTPAVFSARRATEHYHYEIVRCRRCGLVFSRKLLPPEKLLDLYRRSSVTFAEHARSLRRDYWAPLSAFAGELPGNDALEIGCSTGFFLEELLDRGCAGVVGYEPSLEAREKASPRVRDHIVSGFFEEGGVGPNRFGVACSFHTLDHVEDPAAVVRACRSALKPGGLLYLVTHDVDALQAKLLGERSPIFDVEHVYLFNRETLPRLLAEEGFEIAATGRLRNSYPLRYWVHMFPMGRGLKGGVENVLRWTGLDEWSPAIAAGNIYTIARKRV